MIISGSGMAEGRRILHHLRADMLQAGCRDAVIAERGQTFSL